MRPLGHWSALIAYHRRSSPSKRGRCRMLKQIALSTFFRISYTFLPVRTFILITSDKRGIRSFSF